MKKVRYVVDACAVLAHLNDEQGAEAVEELYAGGFSDANKVGIHAVNLLEVYYFVNKHAGNAQAESVLRGIEELGLHVERTLSNPLLRRAGRFKGEYRLSLADSIALGYAGLWEASLVTCDHHEKDPIDAAGKASFYWIR